MPGLAGPCWGLPGGVRAAKLCREHCRPTPGQASPYRNLTPAQLLVPPGPLAQSPGVHLGAHPEGHHLSSSAPGALGTLRWTLAWEVHGKAGDALRIWVPTAGHCRPMDTAAVRLPGVGRQVSRWYTDWVRVLWSTEIQLGGLSDFPSETPSLPACELGLVRGNRVPQLGR